MTSDRFEAAGIRHRVLDSWSASPPRFREDANAEEDLVLGGYRDRVIVELAQNAADAAIRAGVPGRLLLALRQSDGSEDLEGSAGSARAGRSGGHAVLVAANTGTPLDAAGVQALSTLRASAKRDGDTIGRFGVGFAAVLAISDEPAVISRSGGVRFSAADTRELVREAGLSSPVLADELLRRDGHVPVLRLPFAAEGTPPDGYDTAVLLPLRDPAAEDLVLRLLDEVADPLLLAMPALTEIVVERPGRAPVVVRNVAERWHVLRRSGRLPAEVLATRPTEERGRSRWDVTWALPRAGAGIDRPAELPQPRVVHAPTPSDEPLPWPALLIATLPLDPSRRHVAPGPVTDAVLLAAAEGYVELLVDRAAAGDQVWPLIVTGLATGPLDGELRAAVNRLLPGAPILLSAEDSTMALRPRDAVALAGPVGADPATVAGFASWLAGLVHAPRAAAAAFELLGVRRISLAEAVETLPPVADPARWRQVYAALASLAGDAGVREALAFLPVPLADGTVVRGMRGLLLAPPVEDVDADQSGLTAALAVLGARVVHPEAVHPLLERLGAIPAGPRALLELPAVRATVDQLSGEGGGERGGFDPFDGPGEPELIDAVLTLVAAAVRAGELQPGDLPWLGDLVLTDDGGEPTPAAALALPESPAAQWFSVDEIGIANAGLVARWGAETLTAVGVLSGPGLIRAHDVPVEPGFDDDTGPAAELDGWDDWVALVADELDGMPPGAVLTELIAVRDLDAVRPDALPEVVAAIAADPALRPALVAPARIVADGRPFDVPSYTAWWLRTRAQQTDSQRPGALAGNDAEPALRALLPAAPDWVTRLDPAAQRSLGVLAAVADLDPVAVPEVLHRLADDELDLSAEFLVAVIARVAVLAAQGLEVDRPERVRTVAGTSTEVVDADQAVVVEAPMYRQRTDLGHQLPVAGESAAALADLLDLPLAGELAAGAVDEDGDDRGQLQPTAAELVRLLPTAPRTWCEHDRLIVDDAEVDWWVSGTGPDSVVHAATTDGLVRGLAWAAGRWELRGLVAGLLAEPETVAEVMMDQVFSDS